MNLKVDYFDNKMEFSNDYVNVIEIDNKKYFYRFVTNLFEIVNEGFSENINFFDSDGNEKSLNNRIKIFVDYFNLGFDSKKNLTDVSKYVSSIIDENDKLLLQNEYKKIIKIYKKILNDIDLPVHIDEEINTDNFSKLMKLGIDKRSDLLDNLFLLIDIEKVFKSNNLLVFVNLKQYLTRSELIELYKYSVYNQINIMLVDSQNYGGTLNYEKKLIIDENLDEFVL